MELTLISILGFTVYCFMIFLWDAVICLIAGSPFLSPGKD
jgi:hypothetical protein